MTEPHDQIGKWLDEPVEPLPPRPGTFEKIKKNAARRKRHQALAAAATVATVIAVAVAVPRLAVTARESGRESTAAESTGLPHPTPSHPTQNTLTTGPAIEGTGKPLPSGFAAVSATFVGLATGWVLGTRTSGCPTGAAGRPAGCLALARTDDTGASWHIVPGPGGGSVTLPSGVSQVRFLNTRYGWLFGPQLWWTADGGATWRPASTGGQRVISLEAVGDRAFAVFATCSGPMSFTTGGLQAGCSSYRLYSSVAGTTDWRPVPGATSGSGSATVVLGRDTGFLVAASGDAATLSSGPVSGAGGVGAWEALASPCQAAQATGTPTATPTFAPGRSGTAVRRAVLAVARGSLFTVCSTGGADTASRDKEVFTSGDGGHTWQRRAAVPIDGTVWSAAVNPGGGVFLIAASTGLYISQDGGVTWRLALTGPEGGFGYVGMTDVRQGFAIPAEHGPDGISLTTDGARSWDTVASAP